VTEELLALESLPSARLLSFRLSTKIVSDSSPALIISQINPFPTYTQFLSHLQVECLEYVVVKQSSDKHPKGEDLLFSEHFGFGF
jgi:hypothetical protein